MITLWILVAPKQEHLTLALLGYVAVMSALLLLFLLFGFMPRVLALNLKRKFRKRGETEKAKQVDNTITAEVNAAIAMAVYLYFNELHDHENAVLTIKKAKKTYSPWNSKIYNVIHLR